MSLPSVFRLSASVGAVAIVAAMQPSVAMAQGRITLPAMPLAEALRTIGTRTAAPVAFDPDAVADHTSAPVSNARSAIDAVRQAVKGTHLVVARNADGTIQVGSEILVVARRDEAETSTLVRRTSTSSRLGQSLRDQSRNTQVISAKLIEEQQALTVGEALRNGGGVNVNTGTAQSGVSYSVRGFAADGLVNGLPSTTVSGVPAGASQSVANIERVEVLKGPDALLAGAGNMGGSVNIVTKKPNADTLLKVTAETGSFGLVRGSVDANTALNDAKTLSGRVIAVAGSADRNFGGYRGNEEYLFAPSLRFKDANTDVVASVSADTLIYGQQPYTYLNPVTLTPFVRDRSKPLFTADQGVRIANTQFGIDGERKLADWLTFVVRGQHQHTNIDLQNYTLQGAMGGDGTAFVSNARSRQAANTDAVDAFARLKFDTFGLQHRIVAGYTYVKGERRAYAASNGTGFVYNPLTGDPSTLTAAAYPDTLSFTQSSTQKGYYVQDLIEVGPIHLQGSVRHTEIRVLTVGFRTTDETRSATTPSAGVVVDLTSNLSLYGTYARGFYPSFGLMVVSRNPIVGAPLPNTETRNLEAGAKLDLFGDRAFLTASWFNLRQSNRVAPDLVNAGYFLSLPGQQGEGVDANFTGQVLPGWTVNASFTRTIYKLLQTTQFATIVSGVPRDQYSLYTSYLHRLGGKTTLRVGGGLFGRSSYITDNFRKYVVDGARQVDLNATLAHGPVDLSVGVRNVFDRDNYGITTTPNYIPYGEPRNVRVTLGVRFF